MNEKCFHYSQVFFLFPSQTECNDNICDSNYNDDKFRFSMQFKYQPTLSSSIILLIIIQKKQSLNCITSHKTKSYTHDTR